LTQHLKFLIARTSSVKCSRIHLSEVFSLFQSKFIVRTTSLDYILVYIAELLMLVAKHLYSAHFKLELYIVLKKLDLDDSEDEFWLSDLTVIFTPIVCLFTLSLCAISSWNSSNHHGKPSPLFPFCCHVS